MIPNHVVSLLKIIQWLPIPLEIKSVLLSLAWMALNNLSTSHCSSPHLLYASYTVLLLFFKFSVSFHILGSLALFALPGWDAVHKAGWPTPLELDPNLTLSLRPSFLTLHLVSYSLVHLTSFKTLTITCTHVICLVIACLLSFPITWM